MRLASGALALLLFAALAPIAAASEGDECFETRWACGGVLWRNEESTDVDFVPGALIANGRFRDLPLDEHCRESLEAALLTAHRYPSGSKPLPERKLATNVTRLPDALSIGSTLAPWTEVIVARVASITDGYRCGLVGVAQRIDLQVEENLRGSSALGEHVVVVEEGGHVPLDGTRLSRPATDVYPALAVGDLVLLGGIRWYRTDLSYFLEGPRFRVIDGVVESIPHPRVLDQGRLTLEDLRSELARGDL